MVIKCFLKKVIRRMAGDTNVKSQMQPSAYRRSLMGRSYQPPLHLNKIRMSGLAGLASCFLLFKLFHWNSRQSGWMLAAPIVHLHVTDGKLRRVQRPGEAEIVTCLGATHRPPALCPTLSSDEPTDSVSSANDDIHTLPMAAFLGQLVGTHVVRDRVAVCGVQTPERVTGGHCASLMGVSG